MIFRRCKINIALAINAEGGDYYRPDGKNETKGYSIKVQSNKDSHNEVNFYSFGKKLLWLIFLEAGRQILKKKRRTAHVKRLGAKI